MHYYDLQGLFHDRDYDCEDCDCEPFIFLAFKSYNAKVSKMKLKITDLVKILNRLSIFCRDYLNGYQIID